MPSMKLRKLIIGSCVILPACQSIPLRSPNSSGSAAFPFDLQKVHELNIEQQREEDLLKRAIKEHDKSAEEIRQKNTERILKAQQQTLQRIDSQESQKSSFSDSPKAFSTSDNSKWGTQSEKFLLGELNLYTGKSPHSFFVMSNSRSLNYELLLEHATFSKEQSPFPSDNEDRRDAQKYLKSQITCDADFELKSTLFKFKKYSAGQTAKFNWYDSRLNGQNVRFRPSSKVKSCTIDFVNTFADKKTNYRVQLFTEASRYPYVDKLSKNVDGCILPMAGNLTGPQKFFLRTDYLFMNCPLAVDSLKTLEDPIDGFQEKVKMLLGKPLPSNYLTQKNPFAPLDFSQAPKLDAIYVSYLVFRSDYYGNVIAELLKYHANRGAMVRILVSDVISTKKDKKLYDLMSSENGNIKVLTYRYNRSAQSGGWFHQLHRTNHVKALVTLSNSHPQHNRAVIGGRNVHDGFLFTQAPNHKAYPSLVNYGGGEESFVHWRDFEFLVESKEFAERIATQLAALWMQDSVTYLVKPSTAQAPTVQNLSESYFKDADTRPLARHYMSIPFKDDQVLETYYADLIKSAKRKILISTPYFRPLKKVGEALLEASERGVEITLITRLDLKGDTADFILGAVNKDGVNRFRDTVKIYEYTEPKIILHSKLVMIDDELSFLGSVNLNKRSFVHDMENGVLIYSPSFAKHMEKIFNTYTKTSRQITEKQKVWFWQRALIYMLDDEF